MIKFYQVPSNDERLLYASLYLCDKGFQRCDKYEKADFILAGIKQDNLDIYYPKPVFAGAVEGGKNVSNYTDDETFNLYNAYLTAQGALCEATLSSDTALLHSKVLILGYGRISKALLRLLLPLTANISIVARNEVQRTTALLNGAKVYDFCDDIDYSSFDFIFNTIPHPVLCKKELEKINRNAAVIELASFPGGVDNHYAKILGVNLVISRGLPGKYFPKTSGELVAKTVIKMLKGECKL